MAKGSQTTKSVFAPSAKDKDSRLKRLVKLPVAQFMAFGIFIGALVAIVVASADVGGPVLQESSIGEVATQNLKATRDFTYTEPDIAATTSLRQRVAKSVPPVFDWQENLAVQIAQRIDTAFSTMRQALADRARTYLQAQRPHEFERITHAPADGPQTWLEPISKPRLVDWARQIRRDQFDAYLNVDLAEATFETLAEQRFSERTQHAIETIVRGVLSHMIVADIDRVGDQQDNGIYLRRLRGDKLLIEYHITAVQQRLVDMARVDDLLQQAAAKVISPARPAGYREAMVAAARSLIHPNTTYNEAKTVEKRDAARDAVSDVVVRDEFRKGQVIVEAGHIITDRHYRIIRDMLDDDAYINRTQSIAGLSLLVLLLVVTLYLFGRKNVRHFRPTPKDLVFMATSLVLMLFLTWLGRALFDNLAETPGWGPPSAWYFLIPVAAGGMLIRLVLNNEHAIVFSLVYAVLVGLVTDTSLAMLAYTLIGTLVGIGAVQQVKHRMALMWSGLAVGAVNVAAVVALLLIDGELFQLTALRTAFFGFASGVLSGFFVLAVLPLFETVFAYTTDIKLLELANLNHPLLRDLIIRAPGSYHHSMMVGSLSEAAAETVGANPLLCRVGAYYHDVGKTKSPQYFAENQRAGENPHDSLKPNMSALIIKAHVKDGLEMAREHRLPQEIQTFVAQHHGTSLISYFFHKAKQMEDPDIPEVDEKDYRYPGPKPQSRETAICMLADGIEAASRALPNPSPARLKGLVQKMINRAFTDGQLDECDLTLKDLNSIAKAFTRILTGIYHQRPEYPDQQDKTQRAGTGADTAQAPPQDRRGTDTTRPDNGHQTPDAAAAAEISDVWEITKRKVESMRGDDDADRIDHPPQRGQSSTGADSPPDDPREGRDSLPRLGSN